ncbi:hypothetical protein VF21_06820 [Pseudogymnoascus sp. 05NY08]|nr:hypothetical protein VF21_06820 [Pseudogymnoascus sp. 05NY08]
MTPVGQNEGGAVSNLVEILRTLRHTFPDEPPSLSWSPSGRQAIDSSHTLRQESLSLPADPEYISITTLWPHEPDLPPGSSSTSQDGLLHSLGYTQFENIYHVEKFQPNTLDAPNSPRVAHTTGYETLDFLSSAAGKQILPLQFDFVHCLGIAKFREDNEGAITFDDVDDEEFFLCLGPPGRRRRYSPPPILDTSPEFLPEDMDLPFYNSDEEFDLNPPVSKELDPTAPVFEYQPSHAFVQDTAPGADQQALQSQDSICDLPEPELPAETSRATDLGANQQALQSQDPVSESMEPELPAEASIAPVPQPHAPRQRPLRLRELPCYDDVRAQERAELRAQRMRQQNGVSAANGNGTARLQQSQNGNAAFRPSQGPYRPTGFNGFMATATPSRGSSWSSRSMANGPHNRSSGFQRTRNSSFNPPAALPSFWTPKPRSNPPIPTRSGPSKRPQTGSNSPGTTATTDSGLSTTPTSSSSPPSKFKKTAGPSNLVERPATPGPSGEPRTNPATKGKARANTEAASPPRSPPAPTTGMVAWRPRERQDAAPITAGPGRGGFNIYRPKFVSCASVTNADATQTRVRNGTADAGPSTQGNGVPVEPARISDQQPVVTTRPPMPRPTQMSTGNRVAEAGPSTGGRSARVNLTGREWANAIFEEDMRKFRSMGGFKRQGG